MRKYLIGFLFFILFLPFNVLAETTGNSKVGYDLNQYECTSKYQDRNISTSTDAYFSHCIIATCEKNGYSYSYSYKYYSKDKAVCLNGNSNPYVVTTKNGCDEYKNLTCNRNSIKYCSLINYYDCSRKSDGTSFTTTTTTITKKTTKRTTRRTTKTSTTTTTTTIEKSNTNLKSLVLSSGNLVFSTEQYVYDITIKSDVKNIEVEAIPEDSNSTVNVEGNTNLVDGSVIVINVSGKDGSITQYKVNVNIEKELSSNTKLKSLIINGYDFDFDANKKDYTLTINEDIKSLDIEYEVEDSKSLVNIINNDNLTDNSKITVSVTAEDGSEDYYYINILVKKDSNFLPILFIIILILAILAGGYYLYKRFIADKAGDKYEYE